ncbi:MAG: hypothetical protein HY332_22430 [Chloroflexi bacterium]|nr:hypothetical protein [Chloroflexota bacterium]
MITVGTLRPREGAKEALAMRLRSRYPFEAWLDASTRNRTPPGIDTATRRVLDGRTIALWLPKEPIPY